VNIFIQGIAINSDRFTWDKGIGICEMSDLRDVQFHQVWNDACDVGFSVASSRTGKIVTFVETAECREDGEIVNWTFRSLNARTGRVDTTTDRLTITVLND
jgi:hypothetical protein